jgi:aspartyl-tRNA(Asn)/glutamyl-tRNA(Gln) amidotransferase subunit C
MKLTLEDVEHVALLARLELSDEEKQLFATQLAKILEYVAKLDELNTDEVEPVFHVVPLSNVFREDEERPSLPLEKVLQNAPKASHDCFNVPKIIE